MTLSAKRAFALITDSTADIAPHLAEANGISVVPLSVTIGDETMPDGTLTQAEFFARMDASPALPTTSMPPVGVFIEAYERALEVADSVLSVHVSSKLSGTVEAARAAAAGFAGRVHVFDSRNLSWGLGLQVMEAAQGAREGLSVAATLERLELARERVRLIVGLDSLKNLEKGGRIGRVSSFLGSLLHLKVTFTVGPDGAFVPLGRDRGEKAALAHTLDWVAEQMGAATRGRFAVGHAMSEARAQWLRAEIERRFEAVEMVVYEAGTVISTHTGSGWGVALLPVD